MASPCSLLAYHLYVKQLITLVSDAQTGLIQPVANTLFLQEFLGAIAVQQCERR